MNYIELEKLARESRLILRKYSAGTRKQTRYYYSNENMKYISYTYKRYFYSARTPEMPQHQSYKITARDYKGLLKLGAKEETN